jgi:RNA polymerase sigma-70 factor (ECF subfamily)
MMGDRTIPSPRPYEREDELARALAAHDPAAWRQLFDEQYQRVYRYAHLRTGNAADAEEVASCVFTEAVRGIGGFRFRGAPVAAWLLRIAHNETVDLLKRRARTVTATLESVETTLPAPDALACSDEWREVSGALGRLKPEHRAVLVLRLLEGRSVRETAALLGKTDGAIKVTQMRALKALRNALGR